MHDVRQQLESMAGEGVARGASEVLAHARTELARTNRVRSGRRGAHRRGGSAFAALAFVLVLVGGIGGTLVALSGGRGTVRAGSAVRYLLPRQVPAGFTLVRTADGTAAGSPTPREWTRTQRWARFDPTGAPIAEIDVQWGRAPQTAGSRPADALEQYRVGGTPVTVRGHDGLVSPEDGWLVWEERPSEIVYVTAKAVPAYGQNAPALPRTVLDQVAASLRQRADGGFDVTNAPSGFVRLAEWPATGYEGVQPRAALYEGVQGRAFQVHLVDASQQPPGSSPLLAENRRVNINGANGMLTRFLTTPPVVLVDGAPLFSGGTRYLQWIDDEGTRVTISGHGLDDPTLVEIARSIAPVDAATWASHRNTAVPTPTTALISPPTLTPDTTAPPPAGARHFEGSYQGIEHYQLQTKRCPQLDHNLVETFTISTGGIWSFQNLYCGTITDTNLWTGTGTFLFTTSDGTFGGDTYVVARVPAAGGPLPLTITRGTGAYADANGSCLLDNHIRQISFGVQEQSGTFTCAIAFGHRPAPASG
jgi:hypothetical protein